MARNKLTATQLKSITKPGKHGDGDGLYLNVGKTGTKSWVFVFIRNGRRREMGLGALESGTSRVCIRAAREKAEEVRSILGRGGDPFLEMEERQAKKKILTFGQVSDELIASMSPTWKNDKHLAQWRMTMAEYAKPIRKLPVNEIQTDDVLRILKPIWHTKAETARRIRSRIEKVIDHATARGLRDGDNPARWKGHIDQILPPAKKLARGHHKALPYQDVPAFVEKLKEHPGNGAAALQFLILTASRTSEALGARWDEFDLENAIWTVPVARMKAGKEHRVPLTAAALEVIKQQSDIRMNDFVFPGVKHDSHISNMTMTKALKASDDTGATVHGFRSSFRDWAGEETSHSREVAEQALAHTIGNAVEQAYRRGDALEKRRRLMEAWANYIGPVREGVVKLHG